MKSALSKLLSALLMLLTLSVLHGGPMNTAARAEDKVVDFRSDDAEMNAAIGKARAALPFFWKRLAEHPANETEFTLKLGIPDGENTEHFWCADIEGDAKAATCVIANEPEVVKTVSMGQRVTVKADQVSDWMYKLDGKIKGGETIRVILPRLPAEEQAAYRDMLADP